MAKKRSKEKCPSVGSKSASASRATQSDATPNGTPQNTALEATPPTLSTVGPQPNPKGGVLGQLGPMIEKEGLNGLTAAQVVDSTTNLGPKVNPLVRPEYEAFVEGYKQCLKGIGRALNWTPEVYVDMLHSAKLLAELLYPNYDPPPEPTKKRSHAQ